ALDRLATDTNPSPTYFGLSPARAVAIYRECLATSLHSDRLQDSINMPGNYSNEEIGAISHLENVRGLLGTAAHIMAERNIANAQYGSPVFDRAARREALKRNIETMQKLGWDAQHIKEILGNIKI